MGKQNPRLFAERAVGRARLLGEHRDLEERVTGAARQLVAPGTRQRIAFGAKRRQRGHRFGESARRRPVVRQAEAERSRSLHRRIVRGRRQLGGDDLGALRRRARCLLQRRGGEPRRIDRRELAEQRHATRTELRRPRLRQRAGGRDPQRDLDRRIAGAGAEREQVVGALADGQPLGRGARQIEIAEAHPPGDLLRPQRHQTALVRQRPARGPQLVGVERHQRLTRPDFECLRRQGRGRRQRSWLFRDGRLQDRRRILDPTARGQDGDQSLQRRARPLGRRRRGGDRPPVQIRGDFRLSERPGPDRARRDEGARLRACVGVGLRLGGERLGERSAVALDDGQRQLERPQVGARRPTGVDARRLQDLDDAVGIGGIEDRLGVGEREVDRLVVVSRRHQKTARGLVGGLPAIERQRQIDPVGGQERVRRIEPRRPVQRLERRLGSPQRLPEQPGPLAQERDGQAAIDRRHPLGELIEGAGGSLRRHVAAREAVERDQQQPERRRFVVAPELAFERAERTLRALGGTRRAVGPAASSMTSAARRGELSARRARPPSASARAAASSRRAPTTSSASSAPG